MFTILSFFALSFSASAAQVCFEAGDRLSFYEMKAYGDGVVVIKQPKIYEYYVGAKDNQQANENATAICRHLNKKFFEVEVEHLPRQVKTINYTVSADGMVSEPWFEWGGRLETYVTSKIICKP